MRHIQQVRQLASALLAVLLFSQAASAQQTPPAIQWQKSLGGSKEDFASSIAPTSDGGYIVAGRGTSSDGDGAGGHGGYDYWIVKLTSAGGIEWQKSLGGRGDDHANSIAPTSDGGYIVAGGSNSRNGDGTGGHGELDYWIVKLTSAGGIEWQNDIPPKKWIGS